MKLLHKVNVATLATATYLSLALPAFAQDVSVDPCVNQDKEGFSALCFLNGGGEGGLGRLIGNAIFLIFVIAALIALFYLIWGGIKWILSGGDKGKVEAARGTIIAAIIGLVIVFLSFFILNFVLSLFGLSMTNLVIRPITS